MNISTIFLYLLGNREAIQRVANSKSSLLIGAILVFTGGVARNYDQMLFVTSPIFLITPFLASILNSLFIYFFVKNAVKGKFWKQYITFLSLFWMTAPLAWIYAIPVESMGTMYQSTVLNILFLVIVSVWRILLMIRVIQVVLGLSLKRSSALILLPVSMVAGHIALFDGVANSILVGMSGSIISPEKKIIASLVTTLSIWCVVICVFTFFMCIIIFISTRKDEKICFSTRTKDSYPWLSIGIILLFCLFISVIYQQKIALSVTLEKMWDSKEKSNILSWMSQYEQSDFAASHPFPPYNGYSSAQYLINLGYAFEAMKETDSLWVKKIYYTYLDNLLQLNRGLFRDKDYSKQIKALKKIGISLSNSEYGRDLINEKKALFFKMLFNVKGDVYSYKKEDIKNLEGLEETFGFTEKDFKF